MTIQTGQIVESAFEWSNGPEKGMMCRHYVITDANETNEEAFMEGMVDEITTLCEAITSAISADETVFNCATLQRLKTLIPVAGAATRIFYKFGLGIPVSANAPAKGAQQSAVVSLYPASGSNPKQGRNFFPFLRGDFTEEGQIKNANQATIHNELDKITMDPIVASSIGTLAPVIYSKATELYADILSSVLRPVLATQKRRVDHHQPFRA